jgi:cold shock CspA family protein
MIQTAANAGPGILRGVIAKIAYLGIAPAAELKRSLHGGYGLIEGRDGARYFFSETAVHGDFCRLRSGDSVNFDVQCGPLRQAINVTRNHHTFPIATTKMPADSTTLDQRASGRKEDSMSRTQSFVRPESPARDEHDANVRAVLRQAKVDYATLGHTQAALVIALDWQTEGPTFSRKLSGIRHTFRMFCEQVDRIFAIEEHDGMAGLLEDSPQYANRVKRLLNEHTVIRDALDLLGTRLERCLPTDHGLFDDLQRDIRCVLIQIDEHMRREADLIIEAFNTDVGVGD